MNELNHRFLYYVDEASGRGRVIYLRYDGHYGLIEPQRRAGVNRSGALALPDYSRRAPGAFSSRSSESSVWAAASKRSGPMSSA